MLLHINMPLVILCGIPASGKSQRAQEIYTHLTARGQETVLIVDERVANKTEVYENNTREKEFRALLKSTVERELSPTKVVILDWMNYIKGYRYELFCLARNVQTTTTVVFCESTVEAAAEKTSFSQALFRDLASRMESPNPKNRWDSPLFILRSGEPTPVEEIERALMEGKLPRPPVATKQPEQLQGDYLYQLDQSTQMVAEDILQAQETYELGTEVSLPRTQVAYTITRRVTSLELKRARTQFIKMSRLHPCSVASLPSAFADYIQNSSSETF